MTANRELTRKSSAVTLSDMEMFIFPELMYSLVLANIMSPRIWKWREDNWFAGMARMKPYRRIVRLKQYIMDHYAFNLDLDTWGLTTKENELARFKDFVDEDTLAKSNALFGYEGDKYYFDIDIRTHFGLDKYGGNIIPFWKTETVEAMDAFQFKQGYDTGAGECVSLAALYAAALFIVAEIPLKDIYLTATPLHSQNFIDINDGVLTNNRRLVTKTMWFNGTALSGQSRRALENERVTIVGHESGYIHTIYPHATIDRKMYDHFAARIRSFLRTALSPEILGNFLRHDHSLQKCFQVRRPLHGTDHYIPVERVLAYEHGSPYSISDNTRDKLLGEIDMAEFQPSQLKSRIILNDLEDYVRNNSTDLHDPNDMARLKQQFASDCLNAEIAIESLHQFCHTSPNLPDPDKKEFKPDNEPLGIDIDMSRDEIIERLEELRGHNEMAAMAFYAYRDLNRTEPEPFIDAAVKRNPVSTESAKDKDVDGIVEMVKSFTDESIYDDAGRLAQPDEVWNYGRGDGIEKALLLANILRFRRPDTEITISVSPTSAILHADKQDYSFKSTKGINKAEWQIP